MLDGRLMSADRSKISVIILNWNGKRDTLACLESLQHCSPVDVTVVDNGSTDGSVAAICAQFPSVRMLENGQNLGFAEGNNVGIRDALNRGANFIFLLNNDTVVSPTLFDAFLNALESYPSAGIFGAKIYLFDDKARLDHLGGIWNSQSATFDYIGHRALETELRLNTSEELDYVCGAAMMIRKEVFASIGLLEPRYFLIWEESDFCMRAKKAGFAIRTCLEAKIWHKVSASFTGGKPHSTYFWWRNRLLWIERNCTLREKGSLYFRILLPDIFHMLKIYALKKAQLFFCSRFQSEEALAQKKEKLLKNRAALCGVRDYFFRRFGNGPLWIYGSK